jgi:hypothetical protein
MGGMQVILKYKNYFLKKGIVGLFFIPFFSLTLILGLVGLGIFLYLIAIRIIKEYLILKLSLVTDTSFITLDRLSFVPSILGYLGVLVLIAGAIYTLFLLVVMEEKIFKKDKIIRILIYMFIYPILYPFITVIAIYKLIRKDMRW